MAVTFVGKPSERAGTLGCRVEIRWTVCYQCGALVPKVERSRTTTMLRGLCCGAFDFGAAECEASGDGSRWLQMLEGARSHEMD